MSIEDCIAAAQNDWERRSWEIEAELAHIAGQINALYGRATELGAEADARNMMGDGVRSLSHFFEWQLGMSKGNARQLARIAQRRDELPRTIGKLDDGLLSVDQVGPIAARLPADEGADAFAEIAPAMTAAQIRKAVRSTVPPDEAPKVDDDDDATGGDDGDRDVRDLSFGYDDYGTWGAQARANPASGAPTSKPACAPTTTPCGPSTNKPSRTSTRARTNRPRPPGSMLSSAWSTGP